MVSQNLGIVISKTYHIYDKGSKQLAASRDVGLFCKSLSKMTTFPNF